MKFKRNEKYATISFYAIITVLITAFIALVFFKFSTVRSIIKTLTSAVAPITYGFVIAYLCNPLVKFFETKVLKFKKSKKDRAKLKRALSIVIAFVIVFAIIAAFLLLVIPQITDSFATLSDKMGGYITTTKNLIDDLTDSVRKFFNEHESLGNIININKISENVKSFFSNIPTYLQSVASYLGTVALDLISGLKNLLIGIFISIYMR